MHMMNICSAMYLLKARIRQFIIESDTIVLKTVNRIWQTFCPKKNRCFPSRKVPKSPLAPTRTPSTFDNTTSESLRISALWLVLRSRIQRWLSLVILAVNWSDLHFFISTHWTAKPLLLYLRHVSRHSSSLLVLSSPKCAMTEVNYHQSARCRHRTLSCSWLSFVLKTYTSWMRKDCPTTLREANMTASIASKVADAELLRHSTGTPRCRGHNRTLPLSRKTRKEGPIDKCSESNNTSQNSTARSNGLAVCIVWIGTYPWWRIRETGQDTP